MLLCLDVGNSAVYAGVFRQDQLIATFRYNTSVTTSSDQLGVFLRTVLQEKDLDPNAIESIALCSVVPHLDHTIQSACLKYLNLKPFVLQPGVKTGLKIDYVNPIEVGSDRIANAMGAIKQFPNRSLMIVDLGTATTFCAISADRRYLGGVIQVGMRLAMEALQNNTAKLPAVEIVKPKQVLGRTTVTSVQSGVYFGQLAMIHSMIDALGQEAFGGQRPFVIGTGGFSRGFRNEKVFDIIIPDLVLHGLREAHQLNAQKEKV